MYVRRSCAVLLVAGLSLNGLGALTPRIDGLAVVQGKDRKVGISFELVGGPAIVMLDITTNGVSIGSENFPVTEAGAEASCLNRIVPSGCHTLVWDPVATWPGHRFSHGELAVDVKAYSLVQPPDWMVVDLQSKSNVVFYADKSDIPGGIADRRYKTSKLLMRKIPAGATKTRIGSPTGETGRSSDETPHLVTLTNDYYMAVYELTQAQHSNAFVNAGISYYSGSKQNVSAYVGDDAEVHPLENLAPFYFREQVTDGSGDVNWPVTDRSKVGNRTFLGYFRKFTGLLFDLPTETEWEFACRAGTVTPFNDGSASVAAVGWVSGSGSTQEVGRKRANAWDLFDMHGNVCEWCLDYYGAAFYDGSDVVSPVGPGSTADGYRVARGGSWRLQEGSCRSAKRGYDKSTRAYDSFGYRLWCSADLR